MSDGSKKTIKVGFIFQQTSNWMGGINYFKNLFIAMSKVESPNIVPYILKPKDEKSNILLDYAKILELVDGKADVDIVSHSQILKDKPDIAWLPDFQHIYLPEMFDDKDLESRDSDFLNKAQHSGIIILSSNDALDDLKKFFPKYSHKGRVLNFVAILHEDVYKKTDEIKQETIKKFNLSEKYFYLPNQFWKHKNHKVVFEAISVLKEQGIDIQVVFSGNTSDYRHSNHFYELMKYAKEKNIEDNIKLVGLIDLIEVYYLMRNCISIINPSLFEGWSSTVEEAKSLGKNIILSNLKVHKEQNPPCASYFSPHNACELAEILKEKWLNCKSEPDFELEKNAQENMKKRIIEFGKNYQKIVLEALKK